MKLAASLLAVALLAVAGATLSSARTAARSAPIAFTVKDKGITRMYVIKPDGTGLRQLTPKTLPKNFLGDVTPAWSPDSSQLVFARNTGRRVVHRYGKLLPPETEIIGEQLHLFRVAADGGRATQLTFESGTYQGTPSYCPDAGTILFVEADQPGVHRGYMWTMRALPRSDRKPAFTNSAFGAIFWFGPRCSPDGKTVAFSGTVTAGEEGDWPVLPATAQLLAAQPDRLANGLGPNGLSPTWSPDGRRLAWAHLEGRGTTCHAHANLGRLLLGLDPSRPRQQTQCFHHGDIYLGAVMYQNVRNQAQLTNSTADDESPSWSPDGSEIAYASGQEHAALMAIDVKTRKERLIYRPKSGAVTFVAWAPR